MAARLMLCALLLAPPPARAAVAVRSALPSAPVLPVGPSLTAPVTPAPTPAALPSLPSAALVRPALPLLPAARAAVAAAAAAPAPAAAAAALPALRAMSAAAAPAQASRSPDAGGRLWFDGGGAAAGRNAVAAGSPSAPRGFGLGVALAAVFGTHSDRVVSGMRPAVARIRALEARTRSLSDDELKAETPRLKARLAAGASLDEVLPEAFAAVREASRRVLKQEPRDEQVMAGLALHRGMIAEMATGEGKTLAATMPVYLNALTGKGVHVFTVNDYLAKRDSAWMGSVYRFLGLEVGLVQAGMEPAARQKAYAADVTYGTAVEFGFDYLRDNLAASPEGLVQRGHSFAVVDEVDSILIDQARTPLIISGQEDDDLTPYARADAAARGLKVRVLTARERREAEAREADPGAGYDAVVDEKDHTAWLTDSGLDKAAAALGLPDIYSEDRAVWMHYMNQALRARHLYRRDSHYIVKDGEVVIVDDFTGRLMEGRRWSDGLHQAVEAKEGVEVRQENRTLASVTLQNFILLYDKRSGMTGTAATSAAEFGSIYKLDVLQVPTHAPVVREDLTDVVYRTRAEKDEAVIAEILRLHGEGRPVLVGTVSPDKSERISAALTALGVPHSVLNAKHNEEEAEIVAGAGRRGAVTIATNMAGRGTDIMLGGNPHHLARRTYERGTEPAAVSDAALSAARAEAAEMLRYGLLEAGVDLELYARCLAAARAVTDEERRFVVAAGGLAILGTERHESRRIDDQLRGRAGRQGDPGSSRFFLSLEDRLMRMFASETVLRLLDALGWPKGEALTSSFVQKGVESAQAKVEERDFETRESVLKFDQVVDGQRKIVYSERRAVLDGTKDAGALVTGMAEEAADGLAAAYQEGRRRPEAYAALSDGMSRLFRAKPPVGEEEAARLGRKDLAARLRAAAAAAVAELPSFYGAQALAGLERAVLIATIDEEWRGHVREVEDLKGAVNLRVYAQLDPYQEYKKDAWTMFGEMLRRVRERTLEGVFGLKPRPEGTGPVDDPHSVALGRALLELRFKDIPTPGAP